MKRFTSLGLVALASLLTLSGPGHAGETDAARQARCATYARRQVESRGGSPVNGAIGGALAGAALGAAIDGDEGAGKGAAIGGGAGALSGGSASQAQARYRNHFNACMNAPGVP